MFVLCNIAHCFRSCRCCIALLSQVSASVIIISTSFVWKCLHRTCLHRKQIDISCTQPCFKPISTLNSQIFISASHVWSILNNFLYRANISHQPAVSLSLDLNVYIVISEYYSVPTQLSLFTETPDPLEDRFSKNDFSYTTLILIYIYYFNLYTSSIFYIIYTHIFLSIHFFYFVILFVQLSKM